MNVLKYIHNILHVAPIKPQVSIRAHQENRRVSDGPLTFLPSEKNAPYRLWVADASKLHHHMYRFRHMCSEWYETRDDMAKRMIKARADYAEAKMKTWEDYKYDVEQPAIEIIRKMLEKPKRFHIEKFIDPAKVFDEHNSKTVLVDKDTRVKFVMNENPGSYLERRLLLPSVFSGAEAKCICEAMHDVVYSRMSDIEDKKRKAEEKRRQNHRNELMQQYCGE
ncbi:hypothetical protein VPFG_00151 [Vibrio phage nt-1]|uniref:Uncharacterized protein n=1 Tax=Vibrio phage nt-1 TaxID=115992 RepID=R9TGD2_9CAUD|nr:hypothetical protein VPFG_00151 [Vibrio phage nt-1]AGN30153.1 hypothetical protein VPFG_00151 [Vibrio phage nt-1]